MTRYVVDDVEDLLPVETSMMKGLLQVVIDLRDRETGCPWDRAQTFASIAPFTVEEAYEAVDAIENGDMEGLREELGDLLLQVVLHATIAQEMNLFNFQDVVTGIHAKMIRRHPHVFHADGSLADKAARVESLSDVAEIWTSSKARERAASPDRRLLADVTTGLPALTRACKLSAKAASYGFDWPDALDVVAKVREETEEVVQAMELDEPSLLEEVGDLLFSVASLARHLGIDPEQALRLGNKKFERRFHSMADRLTTNKIAFADCDLSDMEAAWQAVKDAEKE